MPTRFSPRRVFLFAHIAAFAVQAFSGEALYFGHPGGAVELPASVLPAGLKQVTIECRIKLLSLNTQTTRIISQWDDQKDVGTFYLGLNSSNQFIASVRTSQGQVQKVIGPRVTCDGRWHYLALNITTNELILFVDGTPIKSQKFTKPTVIGTSDLPVVVGGGTRSKGELSQCFEGFISDVAFWNTSLDQGTIAQRAAQPLTGSESNLSAYYPLSANGSQQRLAGFPKGIGEARIIGALQRLGWQQTPLWNETAKDWFHFSAYDLSASSKGIDNTASLPAITGGNRRIVCNDSTLEAGVLWQDPKTRRMYVTWINNDFSGQHGAALPILDGADFVAGTWARGGNLYYMMVESLPGDRPESQACKAMIRMVRPNGESVYESPVDMSGKGFNWYTPFGRGSMAYANDTVSVILPRTMYTGDPTGKAPHHQASMTANFSADLTAVKSFGNPSSHSFGNILMATSSNDSMGLELGDCFPRAMQIHKFTKENRLSKIIFNYKANLITIEKDGRPLKVSHDANTYTELGGVAEGDFSYSVIFSTDSSPDGLVLDYSRVGIPNESRNLAMLRVAKSFEKAPGGYTISDKTMVAGLPIPAPPETGEFHVFTGEHCRQRNPGVIWLTNYGTGEAVHAPHVLRRQDGSILIVWEKTGDGEKGSSLWGMVVHESGRKIVHPVRIGTDLELDRDDPIVRVGNRDCFLARDRKCNKLMLCCILESSESEPQTWEGPGGWGPENPEYLKEKRRVTTAALRKQLSSINKITDHIERWSLLTAFSSLESMNFAESSLLKDLQIAIAEMLKDPAVRKEQEASQKYQAIFDVEQKALKERNKNARRENLIVVATAYRDLSEFFKETRAGKKAAADFERLKKDLQP